MIKKKLNSTGETVRITFELPGETAEDSIALVGSFNDWDPEANPMSYVKSRDVWKEGMTFDTGQTVEFRYLVDDTEWHNDPDADAYSATPYASENSVLEL
jgi:1,4-alpha-glucan branching enzyme